MFGSAKDSVLDDGNRFYLLSEGGLVSAASGKASATAQSEFAEMKTLIKKVQR